ncbi:hypothetical protein [Salinibacterium sp. M195]|uniref:hypothetical protein n=1 Tax=Salinibacterium sp. M195 TaxID=2583374 RepID=UPI001C63A8F0|nr:hypothetical protein [Salinibacterium sp. M195]QYH34817.1 hypothetical protein FFT87_01995 [Salinibacterium sp. M195]
MRRTFDFRHRTINRASGLVALVLVCGFSLTACVGPSIALKNAGDCDGADVVVNDDSGDLVACLIDDDKVGIRTGGSSGRQWTPTKAHAADDGVMHVEFRQPPSLLVPLNNIEYTLHVLQIPDGVHRDPLVIEQTFNDEFPKIVELKLAGEN